MADLINKNDICFRCSYGGECMAEIEDCKICVHYVCDYEDIQNVDVITEQEIRAKAIDEFAEKIKKKGIENAWNCHDVYGDGCGVTSCEECENDFLREIDEIAEQMKAGGK